MKPTPDEPSEAEVKAGAAILLDAGLFDGLELANSRTMEELLQLSREILRAAIAAKPKEGAKEE